MKIILKYKDYYDYLQGVYGRDDILTFDRRSKEELIKPELWDYANKDKEPITYKFAICNQLYIIKSYKDKLYYTLEERRELEAIQLKENDHNVSFQWDRGYGNDYIMEQKHWDIENCYTNKNIEQRYPILLELVKGHKKEPWARNIILKDFDFPKYVTAHDMFVNISAFMGYLVDNPPIPNNQTDIEKVVSHGFDKKKSFRPKMKKK